MQSRRSFIKTSCYVCSEIAASGFITTALNSCGTSLPLYKATVDKNLLTVPVSSFIEQTKMLMVRSKDLDFDILLIKIAETEYRALFMKCTHRDNPLTATENGIYCPAHGSAFDLKGEVTKEPAIIPLKKFATTSDAYFITIYLKS